MDIGRLLERWVVVDRGRKAVRREAVLSDRQSFSGGSKERVERMSPSARRSALELARANASLGGRVGRSLARSRRRFG